MGQEYKIRVDNPNIIETLGEIVLTMCSYFVAFIESQNLERRHVLRLITFYGVYMPRFRLPPNFKFRCGDCWCWKEVHSVNLLGNCNCNRNWVSCQREPPLRLINNFKLNNVIFAVKFARQFSLKKCSDRKGGSKGSFVAIVFVKR